MAMNTPEELRTIEQQIEDAHNRLLSINNEYVRCQRLKTSEENTIAELQNLRVDNTEAVNQLVIQKEALQGEVSDLQDKKSQIEVEISEARELLTSVTEETEVKKAEIETAESNLNDFNISLNAREADLDKREEAIVTQEESVLEKQKLIKDLISQIK